MTRRTHPLKASTPLPPGWEVDRPAPLKELIAEARRASHELLWALHRQRATWARLAEVKAALGDRNVEFMDGERSYKLAVGDVQWWRGEVNSRANALSALVAAINLAKDPNTNI